MPLFIVEVGKRETDRERQGETERERERERESVRQPGDKHTDSQTTDRRVQAKRDREIETGAGRWPHRDRYVIQIEAVTESEKEREIKR